MKYFFKKGNKFEFKKGDNLSQMNPNWKGDKISYNGIHMWLRSSYGKAFKCEKCEKVGKGHEIHWALLKGKKYERKRENFIQLCSKCHCNYDNLNQGWNKGKKFNSVWRKKLSLSHLGQKAWNKGLKMQHL